MRNRKFVIVSVKNEFGADPSDHRLELGGIRQTAGKFRAALIRRMMDHHHADQPILRGLT